MEILILLTDVIEKIVLLGLLGLSIWSVAIIIDRRRVFRENSGLSSDSLGELLGRGDLAGLQAWCEKNPGPLSRVLERARQAGPASERIDRAASSQWKAERLQLEKGLSVLATLGANAPFIGLFGTVLGIIRAFAHLGSQSGSSAVMSGVSQALYATAAGLFVAIPAVVAFNVFSKKIRDLQIRVEMLRDLYVSKLPKG